MSADDGENAARVILVEGSTVSVRAQGRAVDVAADSLLVSRTASPAALSIPDTGRAFVLTIPLTAAERSGLGEELIVEIARDRVSGILAHVIRGIAADHGGGASAPSRRVRDQLADMVRAMCTDESRSGTFDLSTIFDAATDCLYRRLWDADINSEALARELNVSTRTLHRAFRAADTTVGSWTRERRLEKCRDDLIDPELWQLAVSAIGARWGLPDAAHFSRLFKARFGVSPRRYRSDAKQASTFPAAIAVLAEAA
ncbi:helix-turn-helix transcriptional regulator [Microbacterium sp. SSM24]|uniref:helix-turn-helix transcriptional regulator n=1 Tax=Microbacterium sp. SSM24 TaxID=2991714 RepID=UPI002225D4E2|nr:helix-turn-helix transcriptional regulator [Microbacterium sp. SSM24]MCW3492640.1 helix-turn-helix transcriptional regulator [Microbacterium sp. SSM24]